MKRNKLITLLFAVAASQVFAHGYQTAPYSRTAYLVDTSQLGLIEYNPNQISNNMPTQELGNMTLTQINAYVSLKSNGTGPLAFYKDNYPVQDDRLCGYVANSEAKYFPDLNKSLPDNLMTKISPGHDIQFNWSYSAWHANSNNFVFITHYAAGQYKPNPSWKDLHLVCAVGADQYLDTTGKKSSSWKCKLPEMSGDEKQVMVTIWQRVDPAGENFISCSDVKVEGGQVIPPEQIWTILNKNLGPWPANLAAESAAPKPGQLVTFELYGTKNGVKSLVENYSLSITANNLHNWEKVLAAKINSDTTHAQYIEIGEINKSTGGVIYNENDKTKNYVYLNHTISDPTIKYSYRLTKKKDPNPVITTWTPVGEKLSSWVNPTLVKAKDKLTFALQVNGIEETIPAVTVSAPEKAETQVANAVNKHVFSNSLKVRAGVLSGSTVKFVAGGDNRVYVYRSTDDTRTISYVVRNSHAKPSSNYPVYPAGIGSYKAGDLVQDASQRVYACVEASWCNMSQYTLTGTEGAWKEVHPKAAPSGYQTYPAGQPYAVGSTIADVEGNLYKCNVAGWCNQGGAYTPGIGAHWADAWSKL